jgi:hypothetical protein
MNEAALTALQDGLTDGTFDGLPEARSLLVKLTAAKRREARVKFLVRVAAPVWILAACMGLAAQEPAAAASPAKPAHVECVDTPPAKEGMYINPCAELDVTQVEDHRADPKADPADELGWVRCTSKAKKVCVILVKMGYHYQTREGVPQILARHADFTKACLQSGLCYGEQHN